MTMRHMVLAFTLAACASNQKTQPSSVLPTVDKVAPARNDCPNGAAPLADSRGIACWPVTETNPPAPHCRPERCPLTGYMLWNCPVPIPARDAQGNLELEEAIPRFDPIDEPVFQDKLAVELRTHQCLVRMGPERVRKVAFTVPPGKFRTHHGFATRDAEGRIVFKDGGHLFEGVADQQGQLFFCPFRADCDVSVGPNQDEDCPDFVNCQEVCLDPQGKIIR